MSYANLKLKVWNKAGKCRVYIDTRYVEGRNVISWCDGDWIEADENGNAKATFKGPRDGNRAEMSAMGRVEVMEMLECGRGKLPFATLLERIAECQTAGGNFSYTQYEKAYG